MWKASRKVVVVYPSSPWSAPVLKWPRLQRARSKAMSVVDWVKAGTHAR